MNNQQIIAAAKKGCYLDHVPGSDYKPFKDLNGLYAAEYLSSKGFKVMSFFDTGNNGLAITECGINLSTNGHIYLE